MSTRTYAIPSFESYGDYSSSNYGVNALCFTDERGINFYFSYRTLVAVRDVVGRLVVRENGWGPTTGKHLNWIDHGTPEAKRARLDGNAFHDAVAEMLS